MNSMQARVPLFQDALAQRQRAPSTPHQRLFIRTLMDRIEIDSLFATLFHRRFFEAARLAAPEPGKRIDAVLEALTRGQASALIEQLQKELGHDD